MVSVRLNMWLRRHEAWQFRHQLGCVSRSDAGRVDSQINALTGMMPAEACPDSEPHRERQFAYETSKTFPNYAEIWP